MRKCALNINNSGLGFNCGLNETFSVLHLKLRIFSTLRRLLPSWPNWCDHIWVYDTPLKSLSKICPTCIFLWANFATSIQPKKSLFVNMLYIFFTATNRVVKYEELQKWAGERETITKGSLKAHINIQHIYTINFKVPPLTYFSSLSLEYEIAS